MLGFRAATELEKRLKYKFGNPRILETALTHRSFANEKGSRDNYERLEFLGDSVLGLVAAEFLYERLPDVPEGELSRLKSYLVSAKVLGRRAEEIGLGEVLKLGVGEERSGGRAKPSLLADSLEAILGAVFLDGGIKAARILVRELLEKGLTELGPIQEGDAKTTLQESAQGRGWSLPSYRVVAQEGPDHQRVFTVECWLEGELHGKGVGGTKKVAEQRAAAAALEQIARMIPSP